CLAHLLEEFGVERARVAQRGLEVPRLSSAATRALDREETNLRTLDRVGARRVVPIVERAVVVDREVPLRCERDDERAVNPRADKCGARKRRRARPGVVVITTARSRHREKTHRGY